MVTKSYQERYSLMDHKVAFVLSDRYVTHAM